MEKIKKKYNCSANKYKKYIIYRKHTSPERIPKASRSPTKLLSNKKVHPKYSE